MSSFEIQYLDIFIDARSPKSSWQTSLPLVTRPYIMTFYVNIAIDQWNTEAQANIHAVRLTARLKAALRVLRGSRLTRWHNIARVVNSSQTWRVAPPRMLLRTADKRRMAAERCYASRAPPGIQSRHDLHVFLLPAVGADAARMQ